MRTLEEMPKEITENEENCKKEIVDYCNRILNDYFKTKEQYRLGKFAMASFVKVSLGKNMNLKSVNCLIKQCMISEINRFELIVDFAMGYNEIGFNILKIMEGYILELSQLC